MGLEPWRVVKILLEMGLAVTTTQTADGYTCKVTGHETTATGVGESFSEALARASWRWTLN
jgi:hypothetical protein